MKKTRTRLWSLLLTVAMLLTLLPTTALAEGETCDGGDDCKHVACKRLLLRQELRNPLLLYCEMLLATV